MLLSMGILGPYVDKGLEIAPAAVGPSDRLLTPANAMTVSRPLLAFQAAKMLIRGEKPVSPWVLAMGATDAEGNVARLIDKFFPDSGFGTSDIGAEYDPIADTSATLIVGGAGLIAPRMPATSRAAIATTLGSEGFKAAWAIKKNGVHEAATGERLRITPSRKGKEAMGEKLLGLGMAILASDFDNPKPRQVLGAGALAMSITGSIRGEVERRSYDTLADQMIAGEA